MADDEVNQLTNKLQWGDKFFDGEEGLVAVFDFEYEKIVSFKQSVACASMLFPPILVCGTLFCYPCFFQQQIEWDVHSQHVAITQDGIKFVHDRRKTGYGLGCTDAGRTSKTVPFDKITDCDVTEPAGATCCCVDNVLSIVNVDTASSGGGDQGVQRHELSLAGLKEAHQFKKLVWAMKRANAYRQPAVQPPPTLSSMISSPNPALAMERGLGNEETNVILRDIRSELRDLNANIQNVIS